MVPKSFVQMQNAIQQKFRNEHKEKARQAQSVKGKGGTRKDCKTLDGSARITDFVLGMGIHIATEPVAGSSTS